METAKCSSLITVALLSFTGGGGVSPTHALITSSRPHHSKQHPIHIRSRSCNQIISSPLPSVTPNKKIQQHFIQSRLYAANNGPSREYLASLSATTENNDILDNTVNNYGANVTTTVDQTDFITSLIYNDGVDNEQHGHGESSVENIDDSIESSNVEKEEVEDDDYASSMLFPVRSDVVVNGDGNSTLDDGGVSASINGDVDNEEDCIIQKVDQSNNEQSVSSLEVDGNTEMMLSTCADDDNQSDKVSSKTNNNDKPDPKSTSSEDDDNRTTRTLLKEGEDLPNDDNNNIAGTRSITRYLKRKLSGTYRNDLENERTQEERRQKWTQWMTSGRKSTSPSLDESLLNIDKGDDYVVVAVPAEALPNDAVGVKLSSFPGGKLFQKTVSNMQRELEIRNVTSKVGGGGGSSGISGGSGSGEEVVQERGWKKKQQQQQERKDKKNKEKAEAADLEKQMKLRQQQINLEQRIREKGRVTANDWNHNIGNILSSTILRDVKHPVLCVFTWATAWSVIYKVLGNVASGAIACKSDVVVACAGWFVRHMNLPSTPHSMMVSAMSLLLVFRTNSAYQRFVEGRKIWNDIVDTSRDFSRYMKLYEFAIGTSKVRRINALLASFPYLLRHRIRPSLISRRRVNDPEYERDPENSLLLYPDASLRDTDPDLALLAYDGEEAGQPSRRMKRELCWVDKRTLPWKLLPGSSLELCARAQNRPLWVCDRMAKELSMVDDVMPKWTNRERLALIGCVDKLSRSIGACERIHQTVVPLNYARHALRSLTVWLWTLPFVMAKDLGLLTGPVVAVLSWILFGVYEIGSRIEDPFQGTLRLSIYCDAIRRDILADSIARDTAFELEEEGKVSVSEEGDEDAIFELDSESEEYGGDDVPVKKKKNDSFLEILGL